jgi:hypothetical protein
MNVDNLRYKRFEARLTGGGIIYKVPIPAGSRDEFVEK